jgi:O-antigen ligase
VEAISPARAGLAAAAAPVLGEPGFIPLSVEPGTTFAHLVRVLSYITVFLVVRELGWSLGSRRWLLALAPAAIGAAEACLAISQWTAGAGQVQATGSYVNPNHLAGLLALAAPLGVAIVFAARPSEKRAPRGPWRDLAVAGTIGALALTAVGVVLSLSRMGLVSAMAGVCATLVIILARRRSDIRWTPLGKAATIMGAIAILAIVVYLPPDKLVSRFGYLTSGDGMAAHSRLPLWRDTLRLIREYPLLGCGLGAFAAPFLKHKISEPMLFDQYAHNDYLQALAETGAAGFALLLWALVTALRECWTRRPLSRIDRALAAGVFGAFTAIALHSLTDFNLHIPANAMIVAWIGGIASSVELSSSQGAEFHATPACSRITLYLPLRWAWRG